jgi:hypothetical protein
MGAPCTDDDGDAEQDEEHHLHGMTAEKGPSAKPSQPRLHNGVQLSCIEVVDVDTGIVKLRGHWVAEDCGRIIRRSLVRSCEDILWALPVRVRYRESGQRSRSPGHSTCPCGPSLTCSNTPGPSHAAKTPLPAR